ncbi:MAG: type II toxin-antitoxin system prevent-host-death family antitoxin [Sphingomonadaceae bacterium]|nr:type II toxin-antitoxin system prevent-host-death family antitoxin [Sphingomonadaceae bacterium]
MGIHVNIGQAKDRLSQLVAAAERGEDVLIARAGVPAVRLVPAGPSVDSESASRAEKARRLKAFHGMFKGRFDPDLDWTRPMMTDEEVAAWEEDQVQRFYSKPDEAAD